MAGKVADDVFDRQDVHPQPVRGVAGQAEVIGGHGVEDFFPHLRVAADLAHAHGHVECEPDIAVFSRLHHGFEHGLEAVH